MTPGDEQLRIKETERGARAQAFIEDPIWDEAYTRLMDRELETMLNSPSDDQTLEAKRRVRALHAIKEELSELIVTGELAEMQLRGARDGQ